MQVKKNETQKMTLARVLAAFRGAFWGVAMMSGIVNLLALTGSFFMLQIYDRVVPSRSVPTLLALALLAGCTQSDSQVETAAALPSPQVIVVQDFAVWPGEVKLDPGISGTIEELLYSAEYVFSAGNEKLMLCERGIRTYERASRNTLDINAIPILKEKTHLPVIVDPSHGIGIREFVEPIALAAVMAGADGIIYETHEKPEKAASDGQQTLDFAESHVLVQKLKKAHTLLNTL